MTFNCDEGENPVNNGDSLSCETTVEPTNCPPGTFTTVIHLLYASILKMKKVDVTSVDLLMESIVKLMPSQKGDVGVWRPIVQGSVLLTVMI